MVFKLERKRVKKTAKAIPDTTSPESAYILMDVVSENNLAGVSQDTFIFLILKYI